MRNDIRKYSLELAASLENYYEAYQSYVYYRKMQESELKASLHSSNVDLTKNDLDITQLFRFNKNLVEEFELSFNLFYKYKNKDVYENALKEFPILQKQLWMVKSLIKVYQNPTIDPALKIKFENVYEFLINYKNKLQRISTQSKIRSGMKNILSKPTSDQVLDLAKEYKLKSGVNNLKRRLILPKIYQALKDRGVVTTEAYISKILSIHSYFGAPRTK
ncbi:MAG: hypothetical protein KF816_06185 [Melioribacteraceae bacterium]|nr:hypothetical protein [Melioribacteraceae bacterium]